MLLLNTKISCQQEQYACCSKYDYYGSRRDGAMAEYLAVKQENFWRKMSN